MDKRSNQVFGFWPATPPFAEPGDKSTIPCSEEPKAELAHTGFGQKGFDIGEEEGRHSAEDTRICVHINRTPDRACTQFRECYENPMENATWETRLLEAIANDGRSPRAISLAAGLGVNYVQQITDRKSSPKLDAVEKLCSVLNVSLLYIFTGVPLDRDGEELIRLAGSADSALRQNVIGILRGSRPHEESEEQPSDG